MTIQKQSLLADFTVAHSQVRNSEASHYSSADTPSYVVGVDIGGTNLRLALADMSGTVKATWECSSTGFRDANIAILRIKDGVEHVLNEVSAPAHALSAIAAGAPGVTDVDAGIVIATSYLMGWRDVPLRAMLEDAFRVPAAIDNDVNLAALGESWAGAAKGVPNFIFLAIGTGVGAGIVLNGELFRGSNWTAGEIGYMLVPGAPPTARKRHEPGTLETMIGGEGIREQWQKYTDRTKLPNDLTATQIFDHALTGDAAAQDLLEQSSVLLARAIYNISLVLNCPLFVLGGTVGMHPALLDATQAALSQLNLRTEPRLLRSIFGPKAQIVGALRLAIDIARVFQNP
jgi:glucokinase